MSGKVNFEAFGDRVAKALNFYQRRQGLNSIHTENGRVTENIYSRTLGFLTGREFVNASAIRAWDGIHDHWQRLNGSLGRDVGFFVAALDYFENIDPAQEAKYVFVEEKRLQELFEQSTMDGLTKLYNHWTFMMMLERELDFSRRKSSPLTLMMSDVDNFKSINDRFGHQQGDKVLIQVARILKQNLRKMDLAGRYGGEEFIVAFPDTDADTAKDIAERIRARIEVIFQESGVTISMGIAHYPDVEGKSHCLINSADQALYKAKREGKNQIRCYQSS